MKKVAVLLAEALDRRPTKEELLYLFQNTEDEENRQLLFETACRVREQEMGKYYRFSGGIASILPCNLEPLCSYCPYWREPGKKPVPLSAIVKAAQYYQQLGIDNFHLSGGSTPRSEGLDLLEIVQAIWQAGVQNMHITVNCGASMSLDTLQRLKEYGVRRVGTAFEITNPQVFRQVKPGDNLGEKQAFAVRIGEAGLELGTGIMAGLGPQETRYEDYVNSIFDLLAYPHLRSVYVSKFNPVPSTPMRDHPQCTAEEGARLIAMLRLVLREMDLNTAAGWSEAEAPLALLAGAGIHMLALHTNRSAGYWRHQNRVQETEIEPEVICYDSRREKSAMAEASGMVAEQSSAAELTSNHILQVGGK